MVKDLRNKIESTNPASVLDGNIDSFIEEGIKSKNEKNNFNLILFIFIVFNCFNLILSTFGIETNKFNKIIAHKADIKLKI